MSNINDNKRLWHLLNPDVGVGTTAWRAHLDSLGFIGHSIVDDTKAMLLDGGYWTGNINGSLRNYYSPELLVNGGFATDSDWTKGTGWTISGGTATYDGLNGTQNIRQTLSIDYARTYIIELDVIANEGIGDNTIGFGGTFVNTEHLEIGHHVFVGKFTTSMSVSIFGRAGEVFEIDNVSVKETI